jgi:RsiW-degrading membrane proteinase PrsW (M82 family)
MTAATEGSLRTRVDLERRVRVGSVELPMRAVIAIPGVVVWLAIAVVLTGFDNTFAAFASNAIFVLGLFVVGSLTRTLGIMTVVRTFLLGASAMAVMLLVAQPLGSLSRDPASTVDPIAEEVLKLAPVAIVLWQGRRLRSWHLGATDIMLMAVAAGAGFAVVEDAYIRLNDGWGDTVPFMPTTEIHGDRIRGDRLIAGHAIWTALSGVTIGIAWLMVRIRRVLAVAPLGFAIATIDHIGVNSGSLPILGPLVIALFVVGVAALLAIDVWVLRQKIPAVPAIEAALTRPLPIAARWKRTVESRRLRFAAWRVPRHAMPVTGGAERALRASVVQLVDGSA